MLNTPQDESLLTSSRVFLIVFAATLALWAAALHSPIGRTAAAGPSSEPDNMATQAASPPG